MKIKVIKKADKPQTAPKPQKSHVSEWIDATRKALELRRQQDTAIFFGVKP